ncbi:MAG TPA: nuclear transport factor 2 family protein [Chitinophagaceae bacterium]|nr:nuclear transport factor 2 family protein [Chitinophagaceae bacterium]
MIKKVFLGAVAFLLFNVLAFTQAKHEKEVADAVDLLKIAMINANKTALENLVAEKLSYGHSGGHIDDKREFIDKIVSGASDFVSIDLTEQTISISDDVAVVRHVLNAKTNDAGKGPGEVHLRILLVWQKQKGGWKLLARQAVKI